MRLKCENASPQVPIKIYFYISSVNWFIVDCKLLHLSCGNCKEKNYATIFLEHYDNLSTLRIRRTKICQTKICRTKICWTKICRTKICQTKTHQSSYCWTRGTIDVIIFSCFQSSEVKPWHLGQLPRKFKGLNNSDCTVGLFTQSVIIFLTSQAAAETKMT